VSPGDVTLNSRWHGTLTTPASLAGAVQIKGEASMAPEIKRGFTALSLNVSNAAPGGVHPWAGHRGSCGADEGMLGTPDLYRPLKIGDDGKAFSSATIPLDTPTMGNYFIVVYASAANAETIIACANLAPPTQ
ncbi:MAG: hypothetical protein M3Z10_05925, partial [Gemmatimonadota bacterium]|nr:hypothetical protein [Gemmatimonadota bacterium]